jgi:hypothetical protein
VESDPDLTVVVFSSDSFGASPQCACSGLLECCFCVTRGVPAG